MHRFLEQLNLRSTDAYLLCQRIAPYPPRFTHNPQIGTNRMRAHRSIHSSHTNMPDSGFIERIVYRTDSTHYLSGETVDHAHVWHRSPTARAAGGWLEVAPADIEFSASAPAAPPGRNAGQATSRRNIVPWL